MLTLMLVAPVGAAYSKNNNYDEIFPELSQLTSGEIYPTIVLPGINHSTYYVADEDGNVETNDKGEALESSLLMLDTDDLMSRIINLVPDLVMSLFTQQDFHFSENASKLVAELFKYMGVDANGDSIYNLVTYQYNCPLSEMEPSVRDKFYSRLALEPVAEVIGEENLYVYTFPLIGDPMESAEGLDDFINMVLAQTGAEKVNLVPVSLGGTILTAYMDCGKNIDKVSKIVGVVSLFDGTTLMSDFFLRQFDLSDRNFYLEYFPNMMSQLTGNELIGYLINIGLRILPRSVLNATLTAAFSAILDNVIAYNPQFWAMIPKAEYDACVKKYLTDSMYSQLKAKTDRFQQARLNLEDNLEKFVENGGNVYTLSGCNLKYTDGDYAYFGIVASNGVNSDGIIPVQSTSLGATATDLSSVDSSTCLFPTHAWFFEGQHHEIGGNDVALRLAACLLSEKVTDINSAEQFPQFLTARNTKHLTRTGWSYIHDADNALSSTSYTDEQKAAIKTARDEAVSLVADTRSTGTQLKKAEEKLVSALKCEEYAEEDESTSNKISFSTIETFILKMISKLMLALFGGNGFIGR